MILQNTGRAKNNQKHCIPDIGLAKNKQKLWTGG